MPSSASVKLAFSEVLADRDVGEGKLWPEEDLREAPPSTMVALIKQLTIHLA